MDKLMIKVDHVSKQYILGQIGGTTLRDELQRLHARIKKKEDPTRMIGSTGIKKGEKFLALKDISIEIQKGERVGIIGHNGAGKSTLLKLLSRVTAPTEGVIGLNGRVASMLEVGTGFHGELTGRENVYMNGAILGMTKKEIDRKIEDIIEFSECGQFIDTPVKRYSSGMYVKLAFSVAAHLDSEIMIMDEVLAVGDVAFQRKCINKMNDVSKSQGRTILYVSHNMSTIQQLCRRVVVLDHGSIEFDGDVEKGIDTYLGIGNASNPVIDLRVLPRETYFKNDNVIMSLLELDTENNCYEMGGSINGQLTITSTKEYDSCIFRFFISNNGIAVVTMESEPIINLKPSDENKVKFSVDLGMLAPGRYQVKMCIYRRNEYAGVEYLDVLNDCFMFELLQKDGFQDNVKWNTKYSGFIIGKRIELLQ